MVNIHKFGSANQFDVNAFEYLTVRRGDTIMIGHPNSIDFLYCNDEDDIVPGIRMPVTPDLKKCLMEMTSDMMCAKLELRYTDAEWQVDTAIFPQHIETRPYGSIYHCKVLVTTSAVPRRWELVPLYGCRVGICDCGAVRWMCGAHLDSQNRVTSVHTTCDDCGKES